jgi:hypothetical protein
MTGKVLVRASIAPMHAESRVSSPQISQRLAGHAVEALEMAGDWLRVRGEDGYEGWMHRGYVINDGHEPSQEPERRRLSPRFLATLPPSPTRLSNGSRAPRTNGAASLPGVPIAPA